MLTSKQCEKLKDLLGMNLRTIKAYLMKEDFQRFWGLYLPSQCSQIFGSML